jgi:hypothetical protein
MIGGYGILSQGVVLELGLVRSSGRAAMKRARTSARILGADDDAGRCGGEIF